MLPPRPVPAASSWLPELANRGVVYALLALGLAGMLTELVSTTFIPRLVLYLAVLSFGVVGLVRCRRVERRRNAASLATPPLADGEAMVGALH
jgi:hypothetical protein